jgi:hypothetical protein
MKYSSLMCGAISVLIFSAPPAQLLDPKQMPQNKGSISEGNIYSNSALGMTVTLPGEWHFFDRRMYSSVETRRKEQEMLDKFRAACQGALCEPVEIDVALQSPSTPPPMWAIFLTAHKLSVEYQNRERYPLKEFAKIMSVGSLGEKWIPDGDLTPIQLGGRPAYRLIVHDRIVTTAKAFVYVADANGQVFLLVGTATKRPEELQLAIENLSFTNAVP